MEVSIIFKIAAVGILVSVLSQVLKHSGREEQAFLVSLAGLLVVLFWIVPYIYELFDSIIAAGVEGVEAFSSYHDAATARHFLGAGRRHRLLITCGSDYHGKTKPSVHLGEMDCTLSPIDMEEELRRFGLI